MAEQRLIDAEPLIAECEECASIEWNTKCFVSWADAEEDFAERLKDAPTIDAVPVVHGHWIEQKFFDGRPCYQCNICKGAISQEEYDSYVWNFCAVCGAKMDGVTDYDN